MGRLDRHLGKDEPLIIDGEKFQLEQLGTEYIPKLMKLGSVFAGAKTDDGAMDSIANADERVLGYMTELIDKTLELSLPDEKPEDRKKFGMKYMMVLLPHIMKINSAEASTDTRKTQRVEDLKKRLSQNAKPPT